MQMLTCETRRPSIQWRGHRPHIFIGYSSDSNGIKLLDGIAYHLLPQSETRSFT